MGHDSVRVERDGQIVTVTIDRDGKMNACTPGMWAAIRDAFDEIGRSDARVAVITGANGDFCAGADLWSDERQDRIGIDGMRDIGSTVLAVHGCPKPVVAKVDGVAVGAGFGLALAADLLWCSDRSRFSLIFAKRGLSIDFGTSWLLPRRIGLHRAKRLAFTGDVIDAAAAAEVGFVNEVVPVDELDAAVDELTRQIAAGPPIALSMTKRLLDNSASVSLAQALEAEGTAQVVNLGTEDLSEALAAFVEKRPPDFRGR
jgi:2-(1,2-epoxy-1,2-dihydrophenyl)acetyl-CoA isomerase